MAPLKCLCFPKVMCIQWLVSRKMHKDLVLLPIVIITFIIDPEIPISFLTIEIQIS